MQVIVEHIQHLLVASHGECAIGLARQMHLYEEPHHPYHAQYMVGVGMRNI